MPSRLALSSADRLLLVAPHPDDETLAAGGLLQVAVAAGAAVRVVFFTDGENNPWAQRASERRLFLGEAARRAFGARRRAEALDALGVLGVGPGSATFLGFPDQGATDLLVGGDRAATDRLDEVLREFRPTVVTGPSLFDYHPDHSALAVLLRMALDRLPASLRPARLVTFVIHNPHLRHEGADCPTLELGPEQVARKRDAIDRHRSQMFWRRSWLLGFAAVHEPLWPGDAPPELAGHPLGGVWRDEALAVRVTSCSRPRAHGRRTLLLAGTAPDGTPLRLAVKLPGRTSTAAVVDPRDGRALGVARFTGTPRRGELSLPRGLLAGSGPLFAKLERRFGFFDEAGWIELPPPPAALH